MLHEHTDDEQRVDAPPSEGGRGLRASQASARAADPDQPADGAAGGRRVRQGDDV